MLERLKARGYHPAADSPPVPQKEQAEQAVVQKEVSPPPKEEPAAQEGQPAQPSQAPSSERETSSVEETAKVTGAAPAAPGPTEPSAAAVSRAVVDAAAAVSAAGSGAEETSARQEGARERGRGAGDPGARIGEGSRRWDDRGGDLTRRRERGRNRRWTPPGYDTRDWHRTEKHSRSANRGSSRERTRHRVSRSRSRSRKRPHGSLRSRTRDLDRDVDHAHNRDGERDRQDGHGRCRDRNRDPSHDRHQDRDEDRNHEDGRWTMDAAAMLPRSHQGDAKPKVEERKKRRTPLRWGPPEAHSPTRAPSPTTNADRSKRRRTDSPQQQPVHTSNAAVEPDDRAGHRPLLPVLSSHDRQLASVLTAVAAAAGEVGTAADAGGASSNMCLSPPPPLPQEEPQDDWPGHKPLLPFRSSWLDRERAARHMPVETAAAAEGASSGMSMSPPPLPQEEPDARLGSPIGAATNAGGANSSVSMSPPPLPQEEPDAHACSQISAADAGAPAAVHGSSGRRPPPPAPLASNHRCTFTSTGIHCRYLTRHPSHFVKIR